MHQDYEPTDEQSAQILINHGLIPQQNQDPQHYQNRVHQFVINNPHLKNSDIDYFIKNKENILNTLKSKLKQRYALVAIGHAAKWIKTSHSILTVAASKIGAQGLKAGWGALVNSTAQIGIKQLSKMTLLRTITSKTTWVVAGVVCAIQIGHEFSRCCKKQIDMKQFFINSGKHLFIGSVSVGGGAAGAAAGAAIGGLIGPVGSIIGAIFGGLIGGIGSSYAASKMYEKIQQICKGYKNPKDLYKYALDFFELPESYTPIQLETARKAKYSLYYPDKWINQSMQFQEKQGKKLVQMLQLYEIIVNYKNIQ